MDPMDPMAKMLYENPFLSLHERHDYIYAHMTRSDGRLVAVLPYRRHDGTTQYLARVEICPAHQLQPDTYALTGGIEGEDTPRQAAQHELREEAGYDVPADAFQELGQVRPSKQMDTAAYLFAVDVTDRVPGPILGDGTRWEEGASVRWLTYTEGLKIVDPLFITMLARLKEADDGR